MHTAMPQANLLVSNWKTRAARATELQHQYPAAQPLLHFYGKLLEFQSHLSEATNQQADIHVPLKDQLDFSLAAAHLDELLAFARRYGPPTLASAAHDLQNALPSRRHQTLQSPSNDLELFFSRACLQPLAEGLQSQFPISTDQSLRLCPACGSRPQLVILRPEGEGSRRSLQCSFCLREWAFRRLLCPACGETDKEKLPYFTDQQHKHVRIEACDTCHHYLKSVDLSLDGHAEPLVDEVALSALDLWAAEHGYTKIEKNLIGL